MSEEQPPLTCPFCDNALKPQRLSAGRWLCECCARVWHEHPPPPKHRA